MSAKHRKRARTEEREDGPVDFKSAFKYYKRKHPPPDLGSVIDPERCEGLLERRPLVTSLDTEDCHTKSPSQWEAYRVTSVPGLTVLRNVFSEEDRHYWAGRCLKSYSSSQYKRNIDHPCMGLEVGDWFQEAGEDVSLLDKLRWSTLGYHHDWDTKIYTEDSRGTFPPELSRLTKVLASALGHQTFTPEGACLLPQAFAPNTFERVRKKSLYIQLNASEGSV